MAVVALAAAFGGAAGILVWSSDGASYSPGIDRAAMQPQREPSQATANTRRSKTTAAAPKHGVAGQRYVRRRPPAFHVLGAPREPLDEIPLPARARHLDAWLTAVRRPTAANQRHWLYQHAWIVTGAKFGWWHGAEALRALIRVDRRVESQWGIGYRSEAAARRALAAVEASAK